MSLRSLISGLAIAAFALSAVFLTATSARADVPFAQGIVTFAFDDGYQSFAENAAPVLDAAGLDATIYIYTDVVDGGVFMSEETLQAMHAAGHDVGGHSTSHPDLTATTTEAAAADIAANRTYLLGLGLAPVSGFAYPYGAFDDTVAEAVAAAGYSSGRTVLEGFNYTDSDPYELKTEYVRFGEDTVESVNARIDQAIADDVWLIIVFHEIVDAHPSECFTAQDGGDAIECISTAFLQGVVDHAIATGVCVQTVSEVMARTPCPTTGEEDTTPATLTVSYSTTASTTEAVTATAVADEEGEFTNEGGDTHVFTTNGSFEFRFVDLAGNESTTTASVANIIGEAPNPDAPQCPEGYSLIGGECRADETFPAVCPDGYVMTDEDLCVPQTHDAACTEGELNEETGMCEFESTPVGDPFCNENDNYIPDQDMCMTFGVFPVDFYAPTCAAGILNPVTDKCEETPAPVAACGAGFVYEDGQCASDGSGDIAASCPEGVSGTVAGGICTPDPVPATCPEGKRVNSDGTLCETIPAPPSGGGGGGGGGGSRSSGGGGGGGGVPALVATSTATTTGSVLGAATSTSCFQFTRTLSRGMTGADVMELQKTLIARGHLVLESPTMYFGAMTEAAVKKLQAENGLEQVGILGPKTRALLNACDGVNPNQALIDELTKKLNGLLEQIKQLLAERAQQ